MCVSASGEIPICRIEVRCLNDGSGPDCKHRASTSWKLNDLISALPSLTETTFFTHNDLYGALVNKISTNTENPEWLEECFSRFHERSTNGAVSVFQSWQSTSKSATCVCTESGWLHILLHESDRTPIVRNVLVVSYQFDACTIMKNLSTPKDNTERTRRQCFQEQDRTRLTVDCEGSRNGDGSGQGRLCDKIQGFVLGISSYDDSNGSLEFIGLTHVRLG